MRLQLKSGCDRMRIRRNFGSRERVLRQPAISGKRSSEQSRVGEKDRAGVRAGELWKIKRMEVPVSSLIRLLILHLHLHLHSLYLAALFPTHPLHYTVALDSGSEARYVCTSPLPPGLRQYSGLPPFILWGPEEILGGVAREVMARRRSRSRSRCEPFA